MIRLVLRRNAQWAVKLGVDIAKGSLISSPQLSLREHFRTHNFHSRQDLSCVLSKSVLHKFITCGCV